MKNIEKLKLEKYEKHLFQKGDVSAWFLLYRICQFFSFFVVCIYCIYDETRYVEMGSSRWKWIIYLTNWTYVICALQSLLGFIVVRFSMDDNTNNKEYKYSPLYKIYQAFYITSTVTSVTISGMYWAKIHNPENKPNAITFLVHGGNAIAMFIDFLIVHIPWKVIHMIYPILFGLAYSLFSYIYYQLGGTDRNGLTYIYTPLDWRKSGKAFLFAFECVVIQGIAHLLFYLLYKVRQMLINYCDKKKNSKELLVQQENNIFLL